MSPTAVEQIQSWYCDQCGVTGTLRGPAAADVLALTSARERSHEKKSPECHEKHGSAGVRVVDSWKLPD